MGRRSSVVGLGVALTVMVTAIEYLVWGGSAVVAAVSFGLLATVISIVAARTLKPALGSNQGMMKHLVTGMALRVLGIGIFLVAVLVDRTLFPPLPTAFGYLGVVVPLLFAETKLAT